MVRRSFVLLMGALLLGGTAAPPEQTETGRALVVRKCGGCHATGEQDASANADAPPFRTINRRYPVEALRESFLKGLTVGHRAMPPFTLPESEIAAMVAYLRDLDPCRRPSSDTAAMARCFAPIQ